MSPFGIRDNDSRLYFSMEIRKTFILSWFGKSADLEQPAMHVVVIMCVCMFKSDNCEYKFCKTLCKSWVTVANLMLN